MLEPSLEEFCLFLWNSVGETILKVTEQKIETLGLEICEAEN